LFGFGRNEHGQLGLGISDKTVSNLSQINFFNDKNIIDFVGSFEKSYVLISFDKFFIFFEFFELIFLR
jgi:hypothetical protein